MNLKSIFLTIQIMSILAPVTIFGQSNNCLSVLKDQIFAPNEGRFLNNFGDRGRVSRFNDRGQVLVRGVLLDPFSKKALQHFATKDFQPSLSQDLFYRWNDSSLELQFRNPALLTIPIQIPQPHQIQEILSVRKFLDGVLILVQYSTGLRRAYHLRGAALEKRIEIKTAKNESLIDIKNFEGQAFIWTTSSQPQLTNHIRTLSEKTQIQSAGIHLPGKIQDFAFSKQHFITANGFEGLQFYNRDDLQPGVQIPAPRFISSVDVFAEHLLFSDYSKPDSSSRLYLKRLGGDK